jgi:hypothetical protein
MAVLLVGMMVSTSALGSGVILGPGEAGVGAVEGGGGMGMARQGTSRLGHRYLTNLSDDCGHAVFDGLL